MRPGRWFCRRAAKLTATGYTPDSVTEPHFFCGEYSIEFDKAMGRGLDTAELTCRVLVGLADDEAAQRLLDAMLSGSGPASLKQAVEAARGRRANTPWAAWPTTCT